MRVTAATVEAYREAASRFATGITIVSCRDDVGDDHAMTASSFVSLSLRPLLICVAVERESRFHATIQQADKWAVSVLSEDDEAAARWLATKGRPLTHQLENWQHHRGTWSGAAVGDRALAAFECATWAFHPAGDHDLLVGEVRQLELADPVPAPLLHHRRAFFGAPEPGDG